MSKEDVSDKENDLPSNAPPKDDEIVKAKKEKWARYICKNCGVSDYSCCVVNKMN